MRTNTNIRTRIALTFESYLNYGVLAFLIFTATADIVTTFVSLNYAEPLTFSLSGTHNIFGQAVYFAGNIQIGAGEGNPIMASILNGHGFGLAIVLKAASILAIVLLPLLGRDRKTTFYYGGYAAGSLWLLASIINFLPVIF